MKRLSCALLLSVSMLTTTTMGLEVGYWCIGGNGDVTQDYLNRIPNMKDALTSVSLQWYWTNPDGSIFKYQGDDDVNLYMNYYHPHGIKVFMTIVNLHPQESYWDWYGRSKPNYTTNKKVYIDNLVNECVRLGWDGVDIDWEGGDDSVQVERHAFAEFCHELGDRLHAEGKELAVAFYSSPCWGAPNMSWFPELVGAVDHARTMGYSQDWEDNDVSVYGPICAGLMYDNHPEAEGDDNYFYKYSWKSEWSLACGFDSTVLSIGLEAETMDSWEGKDCRGHIQDILNLPYVPGVYMWSFNLPGQWQSGETWALLKQIKDIEHEHTNLTDPTPVPRAQVEKKLHSGITVSKDGLRVQFAKAGTYSFELFNAAGRSIMRTGNKLYTAGDHIISSRNKMSAKGVYVLKLRGEGFNITKKVSVY